MSKYDKDSDDFDPDDEENLDNIQADDDEPTELDFSHNYDRY